MNAKLRELMDKRGKAIDGARALLDRAEGEKRGLSEDEERQYDALHAEQDGLRKAIEREQRQIEAERELSEGEYRRRAGNDQPGDGPRGSEEYRTAFRVYLRAGESRALQADAGSTGGFLLPPEQFVNELIKPEDDQMFIRARARVFTDVPLPGMGAPSLDNDPDDADWTSEVRTGSEDSSMAFGRRKLIPQPLAKRIKVSEDLLMATDAERIVNDRLRYKFDLAQEKAFLFGNGVKQPLGLFVASNDGIPSARDYSTGNTATAITVDGLLTAKYALKAPYRRKAGWLFHRDGISAVSKLKDTAGQYLWQPSKREGEPDMLLGHRIDESEWVPNTFTTGLYVGLFGDISYYWIAEAGASVGLKRLNELYAENNQVGFIGRRYIDGAPVLAEAFARVKLA
ncbi:phage major capsid protein [Plasticicumulans acidivorans]|uniref:HK97 family phage major capsid protein n=1 Tax=Plasticicumulans acidivorans TaxID=886464 RepID=A0A317N0K0_9GAMM|nr:phage major capsid protein [Plasticicumulans acidivorans]PWV66007.1 HK97 family phage major capsid protein [Plasticicumulans acidivorans]